VLSASPLLKALGSVGTAAIPISCAMP
jgi:hypothetical protein